MLAARRASAQLASRRLLSTEIPVTQVASVLKLNVGDEPTAVKLDAHMKSMSEKMAGQ